MSKITRKTQLIFGASAGVSQIAEFGSLAAGTPTFTTDPAVIQGLTNYLTGWFGAVIGGNSPAIEDMNALCYLYAYQLAYHFQAGIPEWDSGTTYFKGSRATSGGGLGYVSLTDNNLNQAQTDVTKWWNLSTPDAPQVVVGTAAYCTHATLAAAVADSAVGTNVNVLLTVSEASLAATVNLTKAGWRIKALPGVSYTAGAATTAFSVQASDIAIERLRFVNFTTGVTGTSAWTYGRVMNCNFNAVTNEVDDSSAPAGKKPVTLGNITE